MATTECDGGTTAAAPAPTHPEGSKELLSGVYERADPVVVVVVVPAPSARADATPRAATSRTVRRSATPPRIRAV
jgi:hypothetical protein